MTETSKLTAGQKSSADVAALLRSRNSLIWIVSGEEERAERGAADGAMAAGYVPKFWDCATGVTALDGTLIDAEMKDPGLVIAKIRDSRERAVYVLRDFHAWLKVDPTIVRGLRSLARQLQAAPTGERRAVIVLSPVNEIPPELAGHAVVIEWPRPDRTEIASILDTVLAALPDDIRANAAPNGTRDAAIDAAVGLTDAEARSCYGKSLISTRKIDPSVVASEKKRVISKEKVLEWCDPLPGGLDSVGGLEVLKAWIVARRAAFTPAARAYGLPAPKGALLVGVPGCGKSLTAKAIATALSMPLLRLDFGALKGKYVGESEGNIRKAMKVAESMAPCVVWIDEIEKALAGASTGAADGGVSADALGSFLSWMQEKSGEVFVIATANDVSSLPPELLRKGRFDDLFFVDLPTKVERAAVLAAALKSHGRDVKSVDLAAVAAATDSFTGAEIAALVPESMFAAFADSARPITTADLLKAAGSTAPLAKTASEKITKLREWAKGRARAASTPDAVSSGPVSLDL